jgi:hypothetical protein
MEKSTTDKKPYIFLAVCIFIAFIILSKACTKANIVVTRSEYMSIQEGMSYEQVKNLIGEPGMELASTTMPEVEGVMEKVDTKIIGWQNLDGSNANVTFQNDKVIMKAQAGL